jgi:pimeloyl-ACP methyl ester carboxylesterase
MAGISEPFRRVAFDLSVGRFAGIAFGNGTKPVDILFLHANGLNARSYASMLAPLGQRFHVLAIDMRGHGLTSAKGRAWRHTNWNIYRDDILALITEGLDTPVVIAGHSMGATAGLLAFGARSDLVRGLAMIDPVLMPPMVHAGARMPLASKWMGLRMPISRGARRRRADFTSRDEAFEALRGRGFFKTWPDETLRDYVADGFVDVSGGGVTLACSPKWEAANFAAQGHDPWKAIKTVPGPVVVLRAETRSTTPTASVSRVHALRPDIRVVTVEGSTHALPLERPDRARSAIEAITVRAGPRQEHFDF